jgi:hypothetical protein
VKVGGIKKTGTRIAQHVTRIPQRATRNLKPVTLNP